MAVIRRAIERAAQHATARTQSARGVSPAPSLGLDLIRPATDIGPRHAVRLVNFTARHGRVQSRPGLVVHADVAGENKAIETIREHGSRLYAASADTIWEVAASPVARVESLTAGRFQTARLADRMIWVNGVDAPRLVDSAGAWTEGNWNPETVPVARFRTVTTHRGRLYFTVAGSPVIWYGGAGEISGTLTSVDLSLVYSGGACVGIGSLSIAGSAGPDDLAVFFMADGTALLYRGSYPGSDDWTIVGRYPLPPLVSDRPLIPWGGDLVALTREGYTSIRQYLDAGDVPTDHSQRALSARISPLVQDAVAEMGTWDPVRWPDQGLLIVSTSDGSQHVLDIQSGAWSVWSGWDVRSWGLLGDGSLLVGLLGGRIGRVTFGVDDFGEPFSASARSGWDYLGSAYDKHFRALRPHVELQGGSASLRVSVDTDYDTRNRASRQVSIRGSGPQWGEAEWGEAEWGAGQVLTSSWRRLSRVGAAVSLGVDVEINGSQGVAWLETDLLYNQTSGIS
ncbi:MAG: hypothetical protein OXH38_11875 [Chloroflexi bacterium]|nr:hypothetical protein [Chloroflexota bacterium]